MKSLPVAFDPGALPGLLAEHWGVAAETTTYAPVGFGSYHWYVSDRSGTPYFATVDDLDHRHWLGATPDSAFAALTTALATATALREECALDFVVAPLPTRGGAPVVRVGDRHTLALYPHLPGAGGDFGDHLEASARGRLVAMLGRLHQAVPTSVVPRVDVPVPGRPTLERALAQVGEPWHGGPYAEPTRRWLAERAALLGERLVELDRLVDVVAGSTRVVTHGEPHPGNVLDAGERSFLIDWDTVALAPPERDLFLLATDPEAVAAYVSATGHALDPDALALYALAWQLEDVASFTTQLRSPHTDDEDARAAYGYLTKALDKITV